MIRYNISNSSRPQVLQAPEAPRWRSTPPTRYRSIIHATAAVLLHIAACAALLMAGRAAVAPKLPDGPTVAWVFAPPRPAPPAIPEPTPAVEPPTLTPQPESPPRAETPPPISEPTPSAEDPTPSEASPATANEAKPSRPPPIRPPVAHLTANRAKPIIPPHATEPPPMIQPHLEAPASQPTAGPPAAAPPIPVDWQRSLATWLAGHKTYPDEARRKGLEGNVTLRFTVDRSGHVRDVALVRGAGSSVLDASAEAMLRGAALPAFTAEMSQELVTVTVQIRYGLTN